jgi:RimJ/RimL family protein N-acetyltransferase
MVIVEKGSALRRRGSTAVNTVLARLGLRVLAADALVLRLAPVVAGSQIPFPPTGASDDTVTLRALRSEDAGVLARYTTRLPADWMAEQRALNEAGLALDLAVDDRATGAMAGLIQLQRFDWPNHRASVGLWLLPEARGRGLMTHALCLLTGWVFSNGILDRVEYLARSDNPSSIRLAERCGFVREGELRACLVMDRRRHDAVLLAALREDWRVPDEVGK